MNGHRRPMFLALALFGVCCLVVLLAGCSSFRESDPLEAGRSALEAANVEPVAVLDEGDEWEAGVHAHPLRPGQSLAFVFPRPWSGDWTMEGVHYPLVLIALDEDGSHLGRVRMSSCRRGPVHLCTYRSPAPASAFLEVRPRM